MPNIELEDISFIETADENSQEVILERMAGRLPADLSPRPSTPQYISLAASSVEHAKQYQLIYDYYENSFLSTCDRENLIRRAKDYGIEPIAATHAVLEGRFNIPIAIGSVFSLLDLNYTVTEANGMAGDLFSYFLECDTPGEIGNTELGTLIPNNYIVGLTYANLARLVIPGEEEESTEALRARVLSHWRFKEFCGNRADYIRELTGIPGVGRCKIDACPDGETLRVDLYFTDAENRPPSDELIKKVQDYFYPLIDGKMDLKTTGNGVAPIGHLVRACGIKTYHTQVIVKLAYRAGVIETPELRQKVRDKIEEYYTEEAARWGDITMTESAKYPHSSRVEFSKNRLGAKILEIDEVLDWDELYMVDPDVIDWATLPVLDSVYFMVPEDER